MKVQQQNFSQALLPWFIWILSASFYLYKYTLEVSPGIIVDDLMQTFSINGAQMGNLGAFYFYSYLLMQVPMGILLDRYGPRRVTTISILICVAGTFAFASSHQLYAAELSRFVTGIGAAVAAISCLKLTTLWFSEKRFAMMAGLMTTAGMLGAVCGEGPLSYLIRQTGWRDAMNKMAFVGLLMAIIFWIFVRDTNPGIQHIAHPPVPHTHRQMPFLAGLKMVLSQKQTWLLSFYSGLAFAPMMVFGGLWGVPYLQTAEHFPKVLAASTLSAIFIGFACGAPFFGWLSDYHGKRLPIMTIGTSIALITIMCLLYGPMMQPMHVTTLLFIFGFAISAFLLAFSMVREVNHLYLAATAFAFMNAFNALWGAVSDPFLGFLLDRGWDGQMLNGVRVFSVENYHVAMSVIPIYLVVALLIIPFLKETHCKQVGGS